MAKNRKSKIMSMTIYLTSIRLDQLYQNNFENFENIHDISHLDQTRSIISKFFNFNIFYQNITTVQYTGILKNTL